MIVQDPFLIPFWSTSFGHMDILTFRTNPSLSFVDSITMPTGHSMRGLSSLTATISPTAMFLLGLFHFCSWFRDSKYSFFHRDQNCSDRYWIRLHLFLAYMSSFTNWPGGGSGVDVFIVINWLGVIGGSEHGSLVSTGVSGRLFTIAIASYIKVRREASSNLLGQRSIVLLKTFLTVLICLSHTPPRWLAWGVLNTNSQTNSHWFFSKYSVIRQVLILFSSALSSLSAPTKLVPRSHLICLTVPLNATKLHSAFISESVEKSSNISMWTTLEQKHVKSNPYLFISDLPLLIFKGPKQSIPT